MANIRKVLEILGQHEKTLHRSDYDCTPAFVDALQEGVADDMLDELNKLGIVVPTEQLTKALKEYYIDNNSKLTTEEKATKEKFIQYLINKYQISIFESIANNK